MVVTDTENGCTASSQVTIDEDINSPLADAGVNGVLHCNATTIQLNGNSSSSGQDITYQWTTNGGNIQSGANTLTPTVDAAGQYTLEVFNNANGCSTTSFVEVREIPNPVMEISLVNNISCFGESTGSLSAQVINGAAPYTYAWSNDLSTAQISDLPAGDYTLTVTDQNTCTVLSTFTINQPDLLTVDLSHTDETAMGINDGSASANVNGGSGNYTYQWNNGATTNPISGLAPGTYEVIVTDENGCTATEAVVIQAFECAIFVTASAEAVTCFGANDGSVSVSLSSEIRQLPTNGIMEEIQPL